MKYLVDDCLRPTLAATVRGRGIPEVSHATWPGSQSRQDRVLVRRAIDEDSVPVTHDSDDFAALIESDPRHPGLTASWLKHPCPDQFESGSTCN